MNRRALLLSAIVTALLLSGCGKAVPASAPEPTELPSTAPVTEPETTEPEPTASPTVPPTEAPALPEPPEALALAPEAPAEVHSNLTVGALLGDAGITPENADAVVDTSTTGTHSVNISYTYEGRRYAHAISYTVEDTTPPLLLNGGYGAQVLQGEAFDLNELVGYADNADPAPTLTYTGTVDTAVCGSYPLCATVTDAAGNATSWELTVEVVPEKTTPPDNAARLQFADFAAQYGGEDVKLGIDVSKWQGDIDFEQVKAAGCSFVIMRMGYFYDLHEMDAYYRTNMEKAKAAGLEVGVYLYTTANTEKEIRANASWMAEQLGGMELDFPVVFDWESFSQFQQYGMSIHDLNGYYELFAEEMAGYGYDAMLYSSKNFLENFWYGHGTHPIWLAHYTDETSYAGDYVMWQMSCRGRIPGITGDVDFNVLYTDEFSNFEE